MGHIEKMCAERRKQAAERHARWVASQKQGSVWKRFADDADAKSVCSVSSASTAATKTPATFVLTEQETKDARKYAKLLREIIAIEANIARGDRVDKKQLEKVQRRTEIEGALVMQKIG